MYLTSPGAYETSAPNIQISPPEMYSQGDTTYVSGNTNFSHKPNFQVIHSDVTKGSLSFAQDHQFDSTEDSSILQVGNLEGSLKNLHESSYPNMQIKSSFGANPDRKTRPAYLTGKGQNETISIIQQENVAYNSDLSLGNVQSEKMRKVPIVLITIQKGQNAQTKKRPHSNANTSNKNLDNSYKYNRNHTTVQTDNFKYYMPAQIDVSKDQTVFPNKFSVPNQVQGRAVASKNPAYANPSINGNVLQYSVPQKQYYSPTRNWKPIGRSKIQNFESKVTVPNHKQEQINTEFRSYPHQNFESKATVPNYKQEQTNPEFKSYPHEIQHTSQSHGNHELSTQVHSRSPSLPHQQSSRNQHFSTQTRIASDLGNVSEIKSYNGIHANNGQQYSFQLQPESHQQNPSSHSATSIRQNPSPHQPFANEYSTSELRNEPGIQGYSGIHINDGQQEQTFHLQPDGHQQNPSSNGFTSILHRQLNFQNVTFPTNKRNHSHVLSHSLSETFQQTDPSHANPHSHNVNKYSDAGKITTSGIQNLNQDQDQNYDYLKSNNGKTGRTFQNQQMIIDQFSDGRATLTEVDNNFQGASIPRSNSANVYQEMFTTNGLDATPSKSGVYERSHNQNVQAQTEKSLYSVPSNKQNMHNNGYVIFPLDDKYTVRNSGNSDKSFNIVLDKLNTAYDPVKKLFMYQNTDSSEVNSQNLFRSPNEESMNKAVQGHELANSKKETISYINTDYSASKNNPMSNIRTSSLPERENPVSSAFESYTKSPENLYLSSSHAKYKSGKIENINNNAGVVRPVNFVHGGHQQHGGNSKESSEEQTNAFANLPIQYALNYELPFKYADGESHETTVELQNAKNERNGKQFQSSHPEYMKYNSNGDTNKYPLKFIKENQNEYSLQHMKGIQNEHLFQHMKSNQHSDTISQSHEGQPDTLYRNSPAETTSQYKNGGTRSTEFQQPSSESSSFKRERKNSQHRSKSSSPEALVLVLVSEKHSNQDDKYSTEDTAPEYIFDTASKDISELLGEESNAKTLFETVHNASSKNNNQ